jgi:hypothetical protein
MDTAVVPSENARHFSTAQQGGVMHWTLANEAYAALTSVETTRAGPYTSALSCQCGRANPDRCVSDVASEPYLHDDIARQLMRESLSAPVLGASETQRFLAARARPYSTMSFPSQSAQGSART